MFFVITSHNRLLIFFYLTSSLRESRPQLCMDWFFFLGPLPFGNYGKTDGYHLFMGFIERIGTLMFRQRFGPSGPSATLESSIIGGFLLRRFLIKLSFSQIFGVNIVCNLFFFCFPSLGEGGVFLCVFGSSLIYSRPDHSWSCFPSKKKKKSKGSLGEDWSWMVIAHWPYCPRD